MAEGRSAAGDGRRAGSRGEEAGASEYKGGGRAVVESFSFSFSFSPPFIGARTRKRTRNERDS
jgi:hypothetical protein